MDAQLDKLYDKLDSSKQTKPDEILKLMKDANFLKATGKSEDEVRKMLVQGAENEKVTRPMFKEVASALTAGVSGSTSLVERMLSSLNAQGASTSHGITETLGNAAQQAVGVAGELTGRLQGAMEKGKK